jgi:hypothetical protein
MFGFLCKIPISVDKDNYVRDDRGGEAIKTGQSYQRSADGGDSWSAGLNSC